MTFVEITGTNFQNKGAELMLAAVAEECRRRGVAPVVLPWNGSYEQRALLGLRQKAHFQRFGITWQGCARLLPRRLRQQYGIVQEREISAVLDASGFQLGDQWGARIAGQMADRIEASVRAGRRVVLLPQAFGPFEDVATAEAMCRILRAATLVFARDADSHRYLASLLPEATNIYQAPDFTNLVAGRPPVDSDVAGSACILPNQRMLDKADPQTAATYVDFLVRVAHELGAAGYRLTSIVHETKTDRAVLDEVNVRLDQPIAVQDAADAHVVKGMLGQCRLVVASRFHALASALSQGVPCIATGWNHKYRHLMADYECSDWLLDPSADGLETTLRQMLDPQRMDSNMRKIAARAPQLKARSREMWDEAFGAVQASQPEQDRL